MKLLNLLKYININNLTSSYRVSEKQNVFYIIIYYMSSEKTNSLFNSVK